MILELFLWVMQGPKFLNQLTGILGGLVYSMIMLRAVNGILLLFTPTPTLLANVEPSFQT